MLHFALHSIATRHHQTSRVNKTNSIGVIKRSDDFGRTVLGVAATLLPLLLIMVMALMLRVVGFMPLGALGISAW